MRRSLRLAPAALQWISYSKGTVCGESVKKKSQSEIARSFGLKSHSEISRLAKKLGLSQNARSLGQYRRWETSKHRSV